MPAVREVKVKEVSYFAMEIPGLERLLSGKRGPWRG